MGQLTPVRIIYLILCIVGIIMPWRYFLAWFNEHGWQLGPMVEAWHANAASSGLVWDLTVAAGALTIWIIHEAWSRRDWALLISIPATFGVGVSLGLPLHLFLRGRRGG